MAKSGKFDAVICIGVVVSCRSCHIDDVVLKSACACDVHSQLKRAAIQQPAAVQGTGHILRTVLYRGSMPMLCSKQLQQPTLFVSLFVSPPWL